MRRVLSSVVLAFALYAFAGCSSTCPDGCLVDDVCYPDGAANPKNGCQVCHKASSASAWSDADGAGCDDGQFCTTADTCSGGACVGQARSCSDGVACNGAETCDEATKACLPGATPCGSGQLCDVAADRCVTTCGGCVIGTSCFGDGQANPANACQACRPASSASGWTDDDGASCDDGLFCTTADTCHGGACSGTARSCDDGVDCNGTESCDEQGKACRPGTTTCAAGAVCDVGEDRCVTVEDTAVIGNPGGRLEGTRPGVEGAVLEVPAGALGDDVTFSMRPGTTIVHPGYVPVGLPVEIDPSGTQFVPPASVTLPFAAASIPDGRTAADVVILRRDGTTAAVSVLSTAAIDEAGETVRALTDTLSTFQPQVPRKLDPARSSVTADPATGALANGLEVVTVTVKALDTQDLAMAGLPVLLTATAGDGCVLSPESGTTDSAGELRVSLTSARPGAKAIAATVSGVALAPATVEFAVDIADLALSKLEVSPATVVADGAAAATLVATVVNAWNKPVEGASVEFLVSGSVNTLAPASAVTDVAGRATATLSSTFAETKTVTATVAGQPLAAGDTVTFTRPVPRFLFAANHDSSSITTYAVDAQTGGLRTMGSAPVVASDGTTLLQPEALAVDPFNRFAYAAALSGTSPALAALAVDSATGALSAVGTAQAPGGAVDASASFSLAAGPSGKFVYVSYGTGNDQPQAQPSAIAQFAVGVSGGTFAGMTSLVGGTNPGCRSLAMHPSGRVLYAVTNTDYLDVFSVDAATGFLSLASSLMPTASAGVHLERASVSPDGAMLAVTTSVASGAAEVLTFTIDPATLGLTQASARASATATGSALAFHPSGRFLYTAEASSVNAVTAWAIDPATALLSEVETSADQGSDLSAVLAEASGRFLFAARRSLSEVATFGIDEGSGSLQLQGIGWATGKVPVALAMATGASAVTVTPRFLYSANSGSDSVSGWSIASGVLTSLGAPTPINAGAKPVALAVVPEAGRLLTLDQGDSKVSSFEWNAATGALGARGQTDLSSVCLSPRTMVVHPSGRWAYVVCPAAWTIESYDVSAATLGDRWQPIGSDPFAVEFDPVGRFAAVGYAGYSPGTGDPCVILHSVDPVTGKWVWDFTGKGSPDGPVRILAFHPSGRWLAVAGDLANLQLLSVTAQGAAGEWTALGLAEPAKAVSFSPDGAVLFVAGASAIRAFRFDAATGVATALAGEVALPSSPPGMVFDLAGHLYLADPVGSAISAFSLGAGGDLQIVTGSPFALGVQDAAPGALAVVHLWQ